MRKRVLTRKIKTNKREKEEGGENKGAEVTKEHNQ